MPDHRSRFVTTALLAIAVGVFVYAVATYQRPDRAQQAGAATTSTPASTTTSTSAPTTTVPPTTTTTAPPPTTTAAPGVPAGQDAGAPVTLRTLTVAPDHDDVYTTVLHPNPEGYGPGRVEVTAPPTNEGHGLRYVFWEPGRQPTTNHEICATWTGINDGLQQGFALRLQEHDGGWRLLTVTKNIVYNAFWQFNVHVWDTTATPAFRAVGAVTVPTIFDGGVPAFPWHVCTRAVGDHVDLKVWLDGQPEPLYTDPQAGGTVVLPAGWDFAGVPGWFAGHVPPGRTAFFDDTEAVDLTWDPDQIGYTIGEASGVTE